MADVEERERWDDYQVALSEMLSHTSTEWAPWHVIPADHKWFARMSAAAVILHALMEIDPRFPALSDQQRDDLAVARTRLER
jgi:polyphosphate kinase 2 (PPK2 family)